MTYTSGKSEEPQSCPCCNSAVLTSRREYEICEICGWEDDPAQNDDPDYRGGANRLSLSQARFAWTARKTTPGPNHSD